MENNFDHNKKILITLPALKDQGGVSSFYNSILPHLSSENIKVSTLEIGGTKHIGSVLYPLVDQIRFRRAVRNTQPALIHLNPSLNFKCLVRDGLFAWQARGMGQPFLVFWHGWDKDFEVIVESKYLGFFKKSFGRADAFIVLASDFERKLREWGVSVPIFLETTSVAKNLLTGFKVQDKWSDSAQKINEIKILFLARLERAKGVFETVLAIKILMDKNLPVRLTIAGDGNIRQELETYIRSLGLNSQHVNFTGDIRGNNKIRVFSEHHIYCFPTFYGEGMPTSVLEAMAFAMPVVTRPVGGLADMFKDGKMGALVHGKSPEEIARCIEKLILDKEKMEEIGLYNAKYAKEHFMAPEVAKRLLNLYDSVIGSF